MARATGQAADRVVINGEEWCLLASPLHANDSIYNQIDKILPNAKDRSISTGNWDGFVGDWEVVDSCLYLKKVVVDMWDEHEKESYELVFDADTLKAVLEEYYTEHGILAGWFNREKLIIGRGELVTYVHGGYLRNHEEELVVTIKDGRITTKSIGSTRKWWRDGASARPNFQRQVEKSSTRSHMNSSPNSIRCASLYM